LFAQVRSYRSAPAIPFASSYSRAKAEAWREIAEQLRKDNEELKQQLDEAIRLSQVYARKRIDSEAEQNKVQGKVQSLKPPSDSGQLPPDAK